MSRLVMSVVSLAMEAKVDVNDNSNNDNLVRPINILNFSFFLYFLMLTYTINQFWFIHGNGKRTDLCCKSIKMILNEYWKVTALKF